MKNRVWSAIAIGALALTALSLPGTATASTVATVTGVCSKVTPGHFGCFAEKYTPPTVNGRVKAAAAGSVGGYGPADLSSAYQLGSAPSGAGKRIYVIDAFDDPTAAADLAAYRSHFGLPACTIANGCFQKVNQLGQTAPLPAFNATNKNQVGWAGETSLDLDMVSAACPACSITLVEAKDDGSSGDDNLFIAAKEATSLGAKYVSMSWGATDASSDQAYDAKYLRTSGVVYTVATGDTGYSGGVTYPATSPYVIAVGGTSLTRNSSTSRGWSETAWSGSSSGCSRHEGQPAWQVNAATGCSGRANSDISIDSNPQTGLAVYNSHDGGWQVYGGTSAAAPYVAGMAARAGISSNPAAFAYAHPSLYNDVISGSNGCALLGVKVQCQAGAGWDGPTGLGTPMGVPALGGRNGAAAASAVSCAGNLVNNPGFESGPSLWKVAAARVHKQASLAYAGRWYALLDGRSGAHTDTLSRTIRIPSGCRAVLNYRLRITSADHSRAAHDKLTVKVNGKVLQTRSNRNRAAHYKLATINLTRYAGKQVTITWIGRSNATRTTAFYLDNIAVTLSR
ncbi:MAG TPA: S53 family peptidase [Marmoricola sp.]|nr:S53 family peptidase [Marmoricola sp.]